LREIICKELNTESGIYERSIGRIIVVQDCPGQKKKPKKTKQAKRAGGMIEVVELLDPEFNLQYQFPSPPKKETNNEHIPSKGGFCCHWKKSMNPESV
jgi:hypothetical protein